jgi:hypothetical protein
VVRYEDMLADPIAEFTKVVAHLKIDADPARIAKAVGFSSFETLRTMERETGFDEKPAAAGAFFRAGRKDQWRSALTEGQVRRVVARHRAQMARFGYVPG